MIANIKKFRRTARKLYGEYLRETNCYDCGKSLLAYMRPQSDENIRKVERIIAAMKWIEEKRATK